jgi:hypothetical protein
LIYLGAWIRRLSDEKMQIKIKKSPCGRKEKQLKNGTKSRAKSFYIFTVIKRNVKICKSTLGCAKKTTVFVKKTKLVLA